MDFTDVELAFFAAGDALADETDPVLADSPVRPSFWQRMFRRDVERVDDYYAAYVLEVA